MYNPPSFAVEDRDAVRAMLRAHAFGHLVAVDDTSEPGALLSIPAPFLVAEDLSTVRLHLARANPFWRQVDGRPVLLIVAGTDGYVSPRWYPSKAVDGKVVPTWNYEVVHLHGTARAVHDTGWLHAIVGELSDHFEAAEGEPVWRLEDAPADYVQTMLRGIVGLELAVERVEAKRKLSQNRPPADVDGVVAALTTSPDPVRNRHGRAVAEANAHRDR
ncbi:MAG: FMN-binding negative transcriptional regulator [Acidimicrobiales bacterium]|nr:FMN-binding negative transcriptional regulator [Acidimicrobiales bacterium]